jgi:hypothetical protein
MLRIRIAGSLTGDVRSPAFVNTGVPLVLILTVGVLTGCSSLKKDTQSPPAAWNRVINGMVRAEVIEVLGQPSRSLDSREDAWVSGNLQLVVGYDPQATYVIYVSEGPVLEIIR